MDRTSLLLAQLLGLVDHTDDTGTPQVFLQRVDYSTNNNPLYIGVAPQNTNTNVARWRIEKLFYNTNGEFQYSLYSRPNVTWEGRATHSYF